MKRIICICAAAMMVGVGSAYAQGEMDAYRFSTKELNGTARYISMGGAFGALGGDISVMDNNPAGLGIYRSSEIVTTLSVASQKNKTNWGSTLMDSQKTRFNFDNIAYVGYFPTGNDEGLVSWNVGFSYNRVKSFERTYNMGLGAGGYSISDYIAESTNLTSATGNDLWETSSYNPYTSQNWLSTLAFNSGIIDTYTMNKAGTFFPTIGDSEVQTADLRVTEKGAIDKYNFSVATNISNILYIGAAVNVTDLRYTLRTSYDENFGYYNEEAKEAGFDDALYLDNQSKTTGTGYGVNLGVIVRPTDFLRLGVAYNSPTWYTLTNRYQAEAGAYVYDYFKGAEDENALAPGNSNMEWQASTPTGYYTEYRLQSADRWIFSAAAILGNVGLISVDYELAGYKNMRLKDRNGNNNDFDNGLIKSDFRNASTVRVGAEIKVTPQFSLRAGTALQNAPVKDYMLAGNDEITEVYPVGTQTAYSVDRSVSNYTFGFGYRFTPAFYVDLAYVYRVQKQDVSPFPNLIDNGEPLLETIPASLKTSTQKFALTLGYKF
jgi:long-subunit fatty acid transport protein